MMVECAEEQIVKASLIIGLVLFIPALFTIFYFKTGFLWLFLIWAVCWVLIMLYVINKDPILGYPLLVWARKFQTCKPGVFSYIFYIQILLGSLTFTTFLTSYSCFNNLKENLSSVFISQLTIISMIVTITVLAITISGKNGIRITQELKFYPDVQIIVVIFLISFMFNLYCLGNLGLEFIYCFNVRFWVLFFEIASFLLLFGYSYNILTLLHPLNQASYFVYKIKTVKGDEDRLANLVYALFDIVLASLNRGDTYTANAALEKFSEIVNQSDVKHYPNVIAQIRENLGNIRRTARDNHYSSVNVKASGLLINLSNLR